MSNVSKTTQQDVTSQEVLQVLQEMRSRLEAVNKAKTEPIAIVGMACRFPGGANDPSTYWRLLHDGIDAITPVPPHRWDVNAHYEPNPEIPGKAYTKQGGFIEQVDQFDPLFFGISPREAISLDPQYRLLLEVTWEALENAGQTWTNLKNSKTSVFMGVSTDDYASLSNPILVNNRSLGVGRISHLLGLQGSNIQLDTACSSSLVAIHLACQSLRSGESNLALVGGVNLILSPISTIGRCKMKALSPDGRCKTFDAAANGYGQAEGCGVVVLKRLSDAITDGDLISALIRGSAINHDGPSSGLTVPNGMAQKQVIQQALSNARLEPHQVSYLEAHGTGTALGDPIEIEALAAIYGKNRPVDQPLVVGSVKTNIGHLEAAAGVSALIKVVLALQHQEIPPHLHLKQPNPYVDWDKLPIKIPTSLMPWNCEAKPRIAGISSFGISGTNAHLLLEEVPELIKGQKAKGKSENDLEPPLHILTLSTKTEKALEELVSRYQNHWETYPELAISDVCYTANTGRAQFNHRLAIIASEPEELTQKLRQHTAGEEVVGVFSGKVPNSGSESKVAFLFTGQGSQYLNMGRQLYETQPTFRQALDTCDHILRPYLDNPLLEILYPQDAQKSNDSPLDQTGYTQPALFSIEYALLKLWESWGIKPNVVMGHSVGEYVAATVAGVFSLEDGLKLIAARGRLMQGLPAGGEMVSVMASESKVLETLKAMSQSDKVVIAAINGPESIVISGEAKAVRAIATHLESVGIKIKQLQVSHAFHSPLMEPMLAEFEAVANQITYHQPRIPIISNVTGTKADQSIASAQYWVNHVRQPVRFAQGMATLHQQGYETFLEIGAKPILLGMGKQCLSPDVGVWLPSLRHGVDEWQQILSSLGQLYVQGAKVDWSGFDRDYSREKVVLPTYPFQRERYWVETSTNQQQVVGSGEPNLQGTPEGTSTTIVKLLSQGNTKELAEKVEKTSDLPPEQLKLLPDFLASLSQQHQQELARLTTKKWFYKVQWISQAIKPQRNKSNNQVCHWLILTDSKGLGKSLATHLQQLGNECSVVYQADNYQNSEPGIYHINPSHPQEFEQVYQTIFENGKLPLQKVIHLWSLDTASEQDLTTETLEQAQLWGCGSTLHLLQTLVKNPNSTPPKLWMITRGTQPVLSPTEKLTVATSPLWGLGRTIASEHPQLWGGLVDLDPQGSEDEVEVLLQQIIDSQKEDHLAVRNRKIYVARLLKHIPQESQPLSLRSDATYLITGGLGALGLKTAAWMAEKGARNLVLISRRQPSEQAQQTIQSLEELGTQVKVLSADISVESDVANILEQIQTSLPPLLGVIHAAGVLDDGLLQQTNWERFTKVMAPKVNGTWNLHKLTQHLSLDFFVCFSSMSSLLGSPGQGNYAAANAFMDAVVHSRREMGLPGLSINWGGWSEGGMAIRLASQHQNRMQTAGISLISPEQGIQVLEELVRTQSTAQVGVLPVDWSVLAKQFSSANPSSLLLELLQQETSSEKTDERILEKLQAAPITERQDILKTYIQLVVAKTLGINPSKISTDDNFVELGMDSLMGMEVVNKLSSDLDFIIYPREFYERPTIDSLTQYLSAELSEDNLATQPSPTSLEIFATKSSPSGNSVRPASVSSRLPGIIFILSSPRSGSTLLRVMLAGHSSLLSPPELHLLPFDTMKERQEQLNLSYLGEGLQKTFMEVKNLDATASQALIKDLESQNLSIQQVYGMLQEHIAPRLLVDKSPTYAMEPTILERGEALFANSKYIYLVRHPYSVIESFVRMRMQKLVGLGEENPYRVAEQVWAKSNQNILNFLSQLEPERQHQIHYEDLVTEPESVLSQLCDFLNIAFEPELLQPYQGDRMTGGVHQKSLSISDPNFLKHNTIDESLADKWKTIQLPYPLKSETQRIASQLNYELPNLVTTPTNQQPQVSTTSSKEQPTMEEKFLEFGGNQICLCSWGSPEHPVVLCIHGLLEQGLAWQEVALPLAAQGYRVVAPDLFGHGRSSHLELVTSYSSLTFLAQIDRVIQELPDQPLLLVGHSMGAMLATAIASVRPKKIKELILVELPLPAEESKKESAVNQLTTCLDYLSSTPQHPIFPDVATAASRLRQAIPSLSEEFSYILAQRITQPDQGGVRWSWDAIIRTRSILGLNNLPGGRSQYLEMLKSIQVPTTLVYGDSSKLNRPEDLQQQKMTMTQAKRVFLSGGHNLHIDAAAALASLILTSQ
ncbi:type I polyketide synthase [Moorena sp. SIO3H5]|uniref:type I polyketide synthase n=1 Tax=Moorena sp. SIO3H5 TaxID=2607834 RepID=UPI0013B742FF|nr:type I polyketide synthase [Moorena sp. SIO3H5]NEO69631.1 alpha/beta fold hydrolase [Moorena sp. SIO3H5]